ncbi:nucleotidyltransferase family protein [Labrenzia sp. PHM005]|uniref:nucleotidyltransferase family protein n=1 Tax=Labrenzia sp. PHM005 TaxID=2590016 RepID=UPI0011402064|nr:nucleotidyltransferase family protein [Labrenzia sp. PHM005]QDG74550.1 nucleotidyltransferase family protein [Labrenzia sp. PHM005]
MLPSAVSNFDYNILADTASTEETTRLKHLAALLQEIPHIMDILKCIKDLDLRDGWLVSGGIYQTVWNVITDRPLTHGIKDYDVIYYDGRDLSYEAEDAVIQQIQSALPKLGELVEVRNQARVHLWYEQRFGRPYRALDCAMDSLTTYASRTHAVAARLGDDGQMIIHAPFGLANIFAMRLVPNYFQPNPETHSEKAARMKALWPELEVIPWDDTQMLA